MTRRQNPKTTDPQILLIRLVDHHQTQPMIRLRPPRREAVIKPLAHLFLGNLAEYELHGLRFGMQPQEQRPVGLDQGAQVEAFGVEGEHPVLLARRKGERVFYWVWGERSMSCRG